jgi:hypothetical protein
MINFILITYIKVSQRLSPLSPSRQFVFCWRNVFFQIEKVMDKLLHPKRDIHVIGAPDPFLDVYIFSTYICANDVYRRYINIYVYCGIPLEAAPTSVRGQISSDLSLEVVYTKRTP